MNKTLSTFIESVSELPEQACEEIARHALEEVEQYRKKQKAVDTARAELRAGKGVSFDEVKPWLEKLGTDEEPPVPCG